MSGERLQDHPLVFLRVDMYLNDPKFFDRQVWANSVDPDQMGQVMQK